MSLLSRVGYTFLRGGGLTSMRLLVILCLGWLRATDSLEIQIFRDISNCVPGEKAPSGPATVSSTQLSNECTAPEGEGKPAYVLSCVGGNVVKTSFNKSDCSDVPGKVSLETPGDVCTHYPERNTSSFYDCSAAWRPSQGWASVLVVVSIAVLLLTDLARGIEVQYYEENTF